MLIGYKNLVKQVMLLLICFIITRCSNNKNEIENYIAIEIWHYYNSVQKSKGRLNDKDKFIIIGVKLRF